MSRPPRQGRKPTPSPVGFANSIRFVAGSPSFSASSGAPAGLAGGAPHLEPSSSGWRWHALLGAVPLAGYVVIHLCVQGWALSAGPEQRALEAAWQRRPLWDVVVVVLVLVPLLAHAALGLWRVARTTGVEPLWAQPLGRPLQRASALVLLLFLAAHVWQFQGRRWLGELERADYFAELCGSLSSTALGGVPLVAIGYLLGLAAAGLHLGQGLYHAALSWGLVGVERRQRLSTACWLLGVGVFAAGALIVLKLATGSLALRLSEVSPLGAGMPEPSVHSVTRLEVLRSWRIAISCV